MRLKIIRSRRRRKTISAYLLKDTLILHAPYFLSRQQILKFGKYFQKKIKKRDRHDNYLLQRANYLSQRVLKKKPPQFKITWSQRQTKLFGSCNHKTKTIRISSRLKTAPSWVLDYVIIHELAHLFYPNHSQKFWQLVKKYPQTEKAKIFLSGMEFQRLLSST